MGEGACAAEYDQNGNMTSRVVAGQAEVLEWDAENRLVTVRQGASVSTFTYDGDSNRVKATVDGVTTVYIGGYYEETAGAARTYYYHNGQRVAMREAGVTTWLLGDHLGSTSVAYRASDGQTTAQRYFAWGTIRPGPENELPTDYTFTGQKLDESSGLMYYGARWYDPTTGRFVSADTIVPEAGDPQSLNRFTYCRNAPLRYIDPTGHDGGWDPDWVQRFKQAHGGADPTEKDWQDYLFSLSHPGTGEGGAWNDRDWLVYSSMGGSDENWLAYLIADVILGDLDRYIGVPSGMQAGHGGASQAGAYILAILRDVFGTATIEDWNTMDGALIVYEPFAPPGTGGITLGEVVFVPRNPQDPSLTPLLVHEYVHVLQYRKEGDVMYLRFPAGGGGPGPGFYAWPEPGVRCWHRTTPEPLQYWDVSRDANPYELAACELQNLYEHYQSLPAPWKWQ